MGMGYNPLSIWKKLLKEKYYLCETLAFDT